MIAAVHRTSRRPAGPRFVLLVLAVLAGVLAMHGLGPRPVPVQVQAAAPAAVPVHVAADAHAGAAGTDADSAAAAASEDPGAAHHGSADCSHPAGGTEDPAHADGTCAAAGVGSAYAPPALAAALDAALPAATPLGAAAASTGAGRAPPDLSELQLLRI
ncbi:DUF6153 family protein [Streptomyces xanthophaeus]